MIEFYDEELHLDDDSLSEWGTYEFIVAKLETVVFDYKSAAWAVQIPRRLGGAASGSELSADKKFMRRIMHLERQLFEKWNDMLPDGMEVDWSTVPQEAKSDGARMEREEFLRDRIHVATKQRASVATISTQLGLEAWGVKAVRILSHEVANLLRISDL